MSIRNIIMAVVRSLIFPVLAEILDRHVARIKEEVAEMDSLSDEGKRTVVEVIDRLVSRLKKSFKNSPDAL